MKPEVLLAVPQDADQVARLEAAFTVHVAPTAELRGRAIAAHGKTIRAVVTDGDVGCSAEEMDALPNLQIVCSIGAAYQMIDVEAARAREIPVTTGSGANAPAVAEHALGLLMSLTRWIPGYDRSLRTGNFAELMMTDRTLPTLFGKRLGILGLGHIGSRLASLVAGLEMPIGYHNRRERTGASYEYFSNLRDLAAWSDFLVVSCGGGPETRHLVDANVLAALGPGGYLINVGRGSVVDNAALVAALQDGGIAGAALDVVDGEPVVPEALLRSDKVILTPHVGWRSPETKKALIERAIGNVEARLAGKRLVGAL